MDSTQEEVFKHSVQPLMSRFMGGDSVVFFAYGMTNAGKTHTIQGDKDRPGVLPLLVEAVLNQLKDMDEWDLQTSMMEIYQDKIYDLLGKKKDKLSIRDGNGRVEVMKLSSHPIGSADEAVDLMNAAAVKRSKSNTFLNTGSSRSHAIYSLTLNRVIDGREVSAVFQVVDLAGAERGKRTMGTMTQQREANNINMSLMQLWRCLQAMQVAKKDGKADKIPFRESKLTHLLMPLLARVGLKGIAMLTCVNPQIDDYDETISILGNASLACQIKEISDMGRATTVGIVGQTSVPSNPADNIRAHRRIKKERDSDDLSSRATAAVRNAVGRHRSTSNESLKSNASNNGQDNKKVGKTVRIKTEKGERAGSRGDATDEAEDEDDSDFIDESVLGSELKRLRKEVQILESENTSLVHSQIQRETAIREEVAEEMADASAVLLEQIRELQEQVNETSSHFHFDVTKSVKKAKKKQIEMQQEENSADMEEALKEMERELDGVRETYEGQIDALTDEKDRLLSQLEEWKQRAHVAEDERDVLKEELEEERQKNQNAVKAPEADDMPDLTLKIHEGTQTDAPVAPVASPVEDEGDSDEMDVTCGGEPAYVTHLTQTSEDSCSQEDHEDVPAPTGEKSAPTVFAAVEGTASTACAEKSAINASTAGEDRENIRSSIRSRTSSASSLMNSDIVIGVPAIVPAAPADTEEARKSAAAEFENRLKRDQRFKGHSSKQEQEQQQQKGNENENAVPAKTMKSPARSPGRSPLAPVDSSINAANGAVAGGRTRTVYGKDGTISHVPMKDAPKPVEKDKEESAAPVAGKKRLLSPMRSARNGNKENAPKVFHTAKSRAREAALKHSPKPIKEEPLFGERHPISKRLRGTRNV